MESRQIPNNPLDFIKRCVIGHRIFWTYHVNMRMKDRFISRRIILESIEKYEIIESYPDDKYLPSYLIFSQFEDVVFHIVFAVDVQQNNVRIVTAYIPNSEQWNDDFKRRRIL